MCGLVGVYSKSTNGFTVDQTAALEISMFLNQLRGDDSTGLVMVDFKNKGWDALKNVGGWKAFTRQQRWNAFRQNILHEACLAFGHGRAATRGMINVDNAHPFVIKRQDNSRVVLVHNGTLEWDQPLGSMYQSRASVDSEWLAMMIAKHGAEKALSEIDGAIATIWWDEADQTLNFYRNNERPLYYMETKAGEFYLNSDGVILEFLNRKFKLGAKESQIFLLKEQIWFKMSPENFDGKFIQTDIPKFAKKPKDYTKYQHDWEYENDDAYGYNVRRLPHYPDNRYRSGLEPFPPEDKNFWNREIEKIVWSNLATEENPNWEKRVIFRNGEQQTYQEAPPEKFLKEMYENRTTGDVNKVYFKDGQRVFTVMSYNKYKESLREKEKAPEQVATKKKSYLSRWGSRTKDGKKIRHKAWVCPQGFPWVEQYENNCDGEVKTGDKIQVEKLYIGEETITREGKHIFKVVCARIKPNSNDQDVFIDMVFHASKWTKKQLDDMTFFSAEIGSMKLTTPDEQKKSGSHCVCQLFNVVPIDGQQGAIVNAPQPALH